MMRFQSAPLTDVRGDCVVHFLVRISRMFQSAPLTDVRGDNGLDGLKERKNNVSIRSPHGCKGR